MVSSTRSTVFIVFALLLNTIVFFQLWKRHGDHEIIDAHHPPLANKALPRIEPQIFIEEDHTDNKKERERKVANCVEVVARLSTKPVQSPEKICTEFYLIARKAAGIYESPSDLSEVGSEEQQEIWKNTVLLISFNREFLQFFYNWRCILNFPAKYLVYAQSRALFDILATENLESTKHRGAFYYHNSDFSQVQDSYQLFMTPQYNIIVMNKVRITMVLLSLGFNVLLSDADLVWLDDPVPYIPTDADFAAQHGGCNRLTIGYDIENDLVNTGFIWVKSNPRTLAFYADVMNTSFVHHRDLDDQTFFCMTLKKWNKQERVQYWGTEKPIGGETEQKDGVLSFRTLEPALFPAGCISKGESRFEEMLTTWQEKNPQNNTRDTFVVYHPNYVLGAAGKITKLKHNGIWMTECVARAIANSGR